MSERRARMARRSFLAKAGAGAAAVGAAIGVNPSLAVAQSAAPEGARYQPARHAEDDWFDRIPGKHRFFFDTTTLDKLGEAIFFANNYFTANKSGYGLDASELAVVIGVRHRSTAFAFSDEIWAKYGKPLAERVQLTDPKTKQLPTVNLYLASGYGSLLSNNGVSLDAVIKRGVHLAVCQMSTRGNAAAIARETGGNADQIYEELVGHLVPNAHMVPAGIVALNRAQEHGYSVA
jgi:hypothetical protein